MYFSHKSGVRFLFYIYMITIVMEKISWTFGGWGCNIFILFTPVLTVVMIFTYCIRRRPLKLDIKNRKFLKYYLLLITYVLMQFIVIDHTPNMVTQYVKGVVVLFVEALSFFNFLLLINYDDYSIDFEFVSKCFYYLTIANVLYCVLQNINPHIDETFIKVFHSTVVRYGMDRYGAINRPTGFFIESNFNGPFLVIGFVNEIYRVRTGNKIVDIKKLIQYLLIALTAFEIFMTLSLTTYIGFATYGVYVFGKSNIRNKGKWVGLVALFAIAGVYMYITNQSLQSAINSKFSTFSSLDTLKNNSHYVLAGQALAIFTMNGRNILFGTGYNCLNVFFQDVFGYKVMKAHNYYLQRLCELGIIGFLLTVYYLKLILEEGKSYIKEGRLLRTMLIVMLSMNFTYDAFTRNYNIIFVVMALLIFKQRIDKEQLAIN